MEPQRLLLLPDDMPTISTEEQKSVKEYLSSPPVQKYFKHMKLTSLLEFSINEAETEQQQKELVSRFQKLKGVLYMCTFMESNFRRDDGQKPKT